MVDQIPRQQNSTIDSHQACKRCSYAKRGSLIGSGIGLFAVWYMMSGAIDPNQHEHKPIFAAAVILLCLFATFVFLVSTMIGALIGLCFKRNS